MYSVNKFSSRIFNFDKKNNKTYDQSLIDSGITLPPIPPIPPKPIIYNYEPYLYFF